MQYDVTDFSANFLDTRDLNERVDYLLEVQDTCTETNEDGDCTLMDCISHDEDVNQELNNLNTILAEVEYGETLINTDYWIDYVTDLGEDIGGMKDQSWPFNHIDWDAAADELAEDYSEIEVDGNSFYYHS